MLLCRDLADEQGKWLETHLNACAECRNTLVEYERLVDAVMPEPNAQDTENGSPGSSSTWSIEDAERRLFAALPNVTSSAVEDGPALSKPSPWGMIGRYGIAAVLLVGILGLGYEIGHRSTQDVKAEKPATILPRVIPQVNSFPTQVKEHEPGKREEVVEREIASLRQQIHSLNVDISKLQEQRTLQDGRLTKQAQSLESNARDRDELEGRLTKAELDKQNLELRLASVEADKSKAVSDASSLRAQLQDVNGVLRSRDGDIAQDKELLKHDRDIRNLITARDLYIAEIYDVAKTGDTQKPFGRVFYTRGKSLIFYGYDLDQQHGVRNASTFQAWGRHGADTQHDVSLGIMYLDDSNQKRWVLKFNDAATLAKIDTVFVTVEPRGPSAKPTGTPLLFASLRIDPNHP